MMLAALVASLHAEPAQSQEALARAAEELVQARDRIARVAGLACAYPVALGCSARCVEVPEPKDSGTSTHLSRRWEVS